GALLQGAGWVLQAAALDRGALVVVQSLTTLSLVLALPLGARFTDQRIGRTEVVGAIAIVVGVVVFLSVGAPSGGEKLPPASAWWTALALTVALVGGMGL